MSPMKRYAKKPAKATKRRRLNAQERLRHQRVQAQHDIEALPQALEDLGFPDTHYAQTKCCRSVTIGPSSDCHMAGIKLTHIPKRFG